MSHLQTIDKKSAMDIYDSPYFHINKKMLCAFGLWPYDTRKQFMRIIWLALILVLSVPHVIGIVVDMASIDKLMEHVGNTLIMSAVFLKHFTLTIAENKMRNVHNDIANNWVMITDEEEKRILVEYSQRGRIFTIAYICLLTLPSVFFALLPLVPELLNALDPLPVPRAHIFIFNGEFLVESRDDHFFKTYAFDTVTLITIVTVCLTVDSMYTVSVDHGTALYAIITHRLSKLKNRESAGNSSHAQINSYEWVVHTIKLHQIVISFTSNINDSYSMCFLCLTIINIVNIPLMCVIMMIHLGDPVNVFRHGLVLGCLMLHIFVIFWPGQKLINHSALLLDDAYCNEWYETSASTKKILRIFMLRCTQPSLITAGGLVEMNFENYFKVVKTAVSYITVLASFR